MIGLISNTSLTVNSLIKCQVRALNGKGYGAYSELNSAGATIETIPAVMSAPTIVFASITDVSVPITWTAPTGAAAGGLLVSIDYYDIEKSNDGTTWTSLVTALAATSYSDTGLTVGTNNYYAIRAHNKYGYQTSYSAASLSGFTTQVPDAPSIAPVVSYDGTQVQI
jgi:cellulose 1,4-beta-cellobiosidase